MTALQDLTTTDSPLRGTAWMLRRFTDGEVTACLSYDMRTLLHVGRHNEVLIESGFIEAFGSVTFGEGVLDLGHPDVMGRPGASALGAIEARIVAAMAGTFVWEANDSSLTLRRGGMMLEFVAVP